MSKNKTKSKQTKKPGSGVAPHSKTYGKAKRILSQLGGEDLVNVPFNGAGDAPSTDTSSDGGGKKLNNPKVNLILWGDAWTQTPLPNPDGLVVLNDVAVVLASDYLSGLAQYGCSGATFGDIYLASGTPPTNYTKGDPHDKILSLIKAGTVSAPDQELTDCLYVIFMPPGTTPPMDANGNTIGGEHSYRDVPSHGRAYTAWVSYGGRGGISSIFSHELAESLTDPDGKGIQVDPRDASAWHEIADVCSSTAIVMNDVTMQSYWSQADQACIIPINKSLEMEITCIHKTPRNDTHHPILSVGGTNRTTKKPFRMTQGECIASIDRGNHFYVTNPNGGTVDVKVMIHFPPWAPWGIRYFATVPDNTTADNLLSLPECD